MATLGQSFTRATRPHALSATQASNNGGSLALDPGSQRPSALWTAAVGMSPDEGLYDFPAMQALYSRGPDSAAGPGLGSQRQASGARAGGGSGS